MANYTGLLSNPFLNVGLGLLADGGRASGAMKGLLQAQSAAYQDQMMRTMQEKQDREQEKIDARRRLASQYGMQPIPGQGPLNANPQPAYAVDPAQQQIMQGLAQGAPEVFDSMLTQQYAPKAEASTNLARNLAAAGLKPGSEEYQQAMMRAVLKPDTQINMGAGGVNMLSREEKVNLGVNPELPYYATEKGDIKLPPTSKMTEGEAKSIATREDASGQLERLNDLMFGDNAVDMAGVYGRFSEWRAGRDIPSALMESVIPLDEREAETISLMKGLSNTLIAAIRGAQVGPEEQIKFEEQLVMPGQPKTIQKQNMSRLQASLEYLNKRTTKLRELGIPETVSADAANAALDQAGFDRSFELNLEQNGLSIGSEQDGYIYQGGDPSLEANWKKK